MKDISMFEINNNIKNISWKNKHNWFHFSLCLIVSVLGYPLEIYLVGFIWEIWDGFKPWYYEKGNLDNNFIKSNLLFSDKFSLEDIFIFNLGGMTIGHIIGEII